jgi:excisionase family DNA binding protein
MDDNLWTKKDVACFLRVSESWVYLHVDKGDLPYLRVGGLLRFDPEAVRRYAREGEKSATVIPLRKGGQGSAP